MTDPQLDELSLRAREVGALPVIQHFCARLCLEELLEQYVPERKLGRRSKVPHSQALVVMITNILLSREPLYAVPSWLSRRAVEHVGLRPDQVELNDDRIGRALDRLYELEPASLMTALVVRAVREFDIELSQVHSDTTTVTFSGAYEGQKDKEALKDPPLITFGFNKDHRPDLKQLVYSLAVSADGAVPVHYKTYDGNTTDDKTHIETWNTIHDIAGGPRFLYVADSKLCTRENMSYIAERGGTFVTVLPRSRQEDDAFRTHVQQHPVDWQEVRREKNPRGEDKPDAVYEAFEAKERSAEGYRVVWYRSSVKRDLDAKRRKKRIGRARMRLENLEARTGAHRFRSVESARKAAAEVLQDEGAQRWLQVEVLEDIAENYKQTAPGRPGKHTTYRKLETPIIRFDVNEIGETIKADARCDGLFAMVSNHETMSPKELLNAYKYQPFLEKRNEQLKSVLAVAPVFLKKPERVAALLFLYFIAVLIFALVEREVRQQMAKRGIESLPLYFEERACKSPTADAVLRALEGLRRSELLDPSGKVVKTFHDPVPPVAAQILELLQVPRKPYGLG